MGVRGPTPKRSDNRVRRNVTDENGVSTKMAPAAINVKPPAEDRAWHPVIKGWYRSLKESGQSVFYEPSDWQAARFLAHYASKVLRAAEDTTDPTPLRAASIGRIWSMMGDLMTTETSRRRARVELIRLGLEPGDGDTGGGDEPGTEVVNINDFRTAYE
ncbi:hypothetical protein E4P29_25545 [Rhodococcus sp. 1R11]|uniref:phage terminase small subunit n=1 Tax=Rhodococcus sp. 1R11 TaxID=2559614 RepID=UPI0010726AEC|nr:hypothetical protein [Rhodococcus sp. 1R11]TFI40278.1 hypothetical protein E4P29_25545 [Rhodococcus sp. 1R11]